MLKIKHVIDVRKTLNANQRTIFDMYLIKKIMKGKKRCKRHGRHGHKRGYHRRGHGRGHGRGMGMHR